MKTNVGSIDRLIRIVLGIALIGAGFVLAPPWNYVALVVGILAMVTGLTRFCGLYRLLGIGTGKPA